MQVRTYSTMIASNPSYSAKIYAKRWPLAIVTPAIYGVAMLLFFFLLPWFSVGLPTTIPNPASYAYLNGVSGPTIATSGVSLRLIITDPISGNVNNITDSFAFYPLWLVPLAGLAQIILAALFLKGRLLTPWLSRAILITYGVAFFTAFIFMGAGFFTAMGSLKGAGAQISTYPGSGLILTLLLTLVAAIISALRMPSLLWCLSLAEDDLQRSGRMSSLQNSRKPA